MTLHRQFCRTPHYYFFFAFAFIIFPRLFLYPFFFSFQWCREYFFYGQRTRWVTEKRKEKKNELLSFFGYRYRLSWINSFFYSTCCKDFFFFYCTHTIRDNMTMIFVLYEPLLLLNDSSIETQEMLKA